MAFKINTAEGKKLVPFVQDVSEYVAKELSKYMPRGGRI